MTPKKIPYLSFDGIHDPIAKELKAAASNVIDSNWFVLGQEVRSFEEAFANYTGCRYAVGVASGLDALIISLKCLGIGPGHEVLVASNAYIACWNAIHAVGATIVPLEPDPNSLNIDVNLIESKITDKTKAIMPVHLYGRICEMPAIMEIAKQNDLFVIEDNAQAQGASFRNKKSASWGHINATSFYPGKNLGALGDAGIITTDDKDLAELAAALRNYGSKEKYLNEYIGMNSRLDEMQAAFLNVKLKYIDAWNKERLQIANWYSQLLANQPRLKIPSFHNDNSYIGHIYLVRCKQRDQLQDYLKEKGIQTLIHYPTPPFRQKAYDFLKINPNDYPIADELSNTCLSLPIYPGLSYEDVDYISKTVIAFFGD